MLDNQPQMNEPVRDSGAGAAYAEAMEEERVNGHSQAPNV